MLLPDDGAELFVVGGLDAGGVPCGDDVVRGDVVVWTGGGAAGLLEFVGCVGVDPTEVGDGGSVVGGTCDVVEDGPGGVAGSEGVAAGSTASATATTPTVASPVPTTAMARRRERTAWPRWIRSAAVTARGGAPSPCRAEKVARRSSSRTITPPA